MSALPLQPPQPSREWRRLSLTWVLWLGALMAAAGAVYFGVAIALGAFRLTELKSQLLRRRR